MSLDSSSSRIFATLAGILVLLLAGAAIFGEIEILAFHQTEIDTRLDNAADLLSAPVADALSGRGDRSAFAARIEELGRSTRLRLTVIAADGTVIADSEAKPPLANHGDRPEIQEALERGRGASSRLSATTRLETRYVAHRIDEKGKVLGFMRAAAELEEMQAAISTLRKSLIFGGVLALLAGLAGSAILARWLARPLEEIGRNAELVAVGEENVIMTASGPREVRNLATTIHALSVKLRDRLETTRRARSEIEAILASMAEGVVAVDINERVLLMNQAAARILGLEHPLESGAALWEKLRYPDLESALRSVLGGKGAWHDDAPSPRSDGRTIAMSVAPVGPGTPVASGTSGASGIPDASSTSPGEPSFFGAVALLSDVTAIRRLEQVRIDFVANVSHELRTPLAAVMGAIETLNDPQQDADTRRRFLDIARRNAERLQAIVSDLLDLSSIEAEGDAMPLEPVRIDAPLRAAAVALAGAAESKGVKLGIPPPASSPVLVSGNPQRLEQVFTNLLENAIKYTPSGGCVSARVRATQRDVSVDVEDTGIGIPTSSLPRVFERFYRVDRSRSREMGGTGLGLAIVKHVMRAHGGAVEVDSEEGRGSTFTITLPRLFEARRSTAEKRAEGAER